MIGTKVRSFAPQINVSLEELVPQDHFYRHLDQKLDLSFVRELVQQTYTGAGRPCVDPIVFWHRCNWSCSLKASGQNADECARRLIGSACAGMLATTWVSLCLIIRA
jgi:hypothetical protein